MANTQRKRRALRRQGGAKAPPVKKRAATAKSKAIATKKIPKPKTVHRVLKAKRIKTAKPKKPIRKKIVLKTRPRKKARAPKPQTRSWKRLRDALGRFLAPPKPPKRRKKARLRKSATKATRAKKTPARKIAAPKIKPRISVRKLKSGEIRTIAFDVPFKNLEQWLRDLAKDPTLNGQIPQGARLGFRYFGNNSLQTFDNVKDAIFRLQTYETTLTADEDSAEAQLDVYNNVEFVLIENGAQGTWGAQRARFVEERHAAKRRRKHGDSEYKKTYWFRIKQRNPGVYQSQLAHKRAKARARYQRLKNDPAYKAKHRAAQRKYYRSFKA